VIKLSCPYKLEPLKDRLAGIGQDAFLQVCKDYAKDFTEWNQEMNIVNDEAIRRGITFQSGNLLLGFDRS
jgi:hypothetical protein